MSERRYDDDEVAEILDRATRTPEGPDQGVRGSAVAGDGLTLSDLEAIGADVGIPPTRIAEAARSLDRQDRVAPARTLLGAPRSVSRTVPLEGPLDDLQWERLVGEVRMTFGAAGKITTHGSLRSWTNGNLRVHVEPHDDRWRLRMQTLKGDAASWAGMGAFFAGFGLLFLVLSVVGGLDFRELIIAVTFLAAGVGQLGYVRTSLPRWADERRRQMDHLAQRLPHLLES